MSSIKELIGSVIDQQPIEFEAAFKDALLAKLQTVVDDRKAELAKSLFNNSEEETEDQEEAE